jgi:hypothetical protein
MIFKSAMRFRFTIRDLLWLTAFVAVVAGCWRLMPSRESQGSLGGMPKKIGLHMPDYSESIHHSE